MKKRKIPEEKLFSIEELDARTMKKLNVPAEKLQYVKLGYVVRAAMEAMCEEINDIRKELRRKI